MNKINFCFSYLVIDAPDIAILFPQLFPDNAEYDGFCRLTHCVVMS